MTQAAPVLFMRRLLMAAILTMAMAGCGSTPAEQEEERFSVILHQSDRTLDRTELIYYLNQSHGSDADRLINQGMLRWAVANRANYAQLALHLQAFRTDGINRAAEQLSP